MDLCLRASWLCSFHLGQTRQILAPQRSAKFTQFLHTWFGKTIWTFWCIPQSSLESASKVCIPGLYPLFSGRCRRTTPILGGRFPVSVLVSDQLFPAAPEGVEGARPVLPPPPTLPHLLRDGDPVDQLRNEAEQGFSLLPSGWAFQSRALGLILSSLSCREGAWDEKENWGGVGVSGHL